MKSAFICVHLRLNSERRGRTTNIQHRTSNIEHPTTNSMANSSGCGVLSAAAGIAPGAAMHPVHRVAEEVSGVAQAQLVLDVFTMALNGFGAHVQFGGDVRGPFAGAKHLE